MKLDFSQPKKSGKLKLDFHPQVYMRHKTHTYLWLRDGRAFGHFLTMDSGTIEVVKVPFETIVERDEKTKKVIREVQVYTIQESRDQAYELTVHHYDFLKAVEKYHSSQLGRSNAAEREMRAILGLEPLAVTDTEDIGTAQPQAQRPAKDRKEAAAGGYSLATLCQELKMDPAEARKILRSKKIEKPGGKWEWPTAEAAASIRTALGG